ncbi:hypothetical protein, partial [Paenibacillus thiaminolyticus]
EIHHIKNEVPQNPWIFSTACFLQDSSLIILQQTGKRAQQNPEARSPRAPALPLTPQLKLIWKLSLPK